jgi:hypothetical protein
MTITAMNLLDILQRTLNQESGPHALVDELANQAMIVLRDPAADGNYLLHEIIVHCANSRESGNANDLLLLRMHNWAIQKDAEVNPSWDLLTSPNTIERRSRIIELLRLDTADSISYDTTFPAWIAGNILIAANHTPWYTQARKEESQFYGPSILAYLRRRNIPEESITLVDQASDQILDYLADPKASETYASRGLVVGYVQSGKTTNINVLIAKAIDSGYRLIIVFAGLTDVLRTQTQRRVDKEVVGKTLIETDEIEKDGAGYVQQKDWEDFIEHKPIPGQAMGPVIERMTTRHFDFSKGKGAAIFTNDWATSGTSARIVVIKKNAPRLKTLIKEIKKMNLDSRNSLPALIIDDESDQASINTANPKKRNTDGEKARTTTNRRIVELLQTLKRCQYIGYTATPFANVLINPDDPEDLFPKDFVYALAQPIGYMGVRDFHDLDDEFMPVEDVPPSQSNCTERPELESDFVTTRCSIQIQLAAGLTTPLVIASKRYGCLLAITP